MFKQLKEDLDSIMERDPAARSRLEVYLLYSGFKAVRSYRKANCCLLYTSTNRITRTTYYRCKADR